MMDAGLVRQGRGHHTTGGPSPAHVSSRGSGGWKPEVGPRRGSWGDPPSWSADSTLSLCPRRDVANPSLMPSRNPHPEAPLHHHLGAGAGHGIWGCSVQSVGCWY